MHLETVRAGVGAAAADCDPKMHNRPRWFEILYELLA